MLYYAYITCITYNLMFSSGFDCNVGFILGESRTLRTNRSPLSLKTGITWANCSVVSWSGYLFSEESLSPINVCFISTYMYYI